MTSEELAAARKRVVGPYLPAECHPVEWAAWGWNHDWAPFNGCTERT